MKILTKGIDVTHETDEQLAARVLRGEFGNGLERRQLLGRRFAAVQAAVNNGGGGTASTNQEPVESNPKPAGARRITISSGHGSRISGAVGILNEVTEARRVTDRVAELLREQGHVCHVFHDDTSTTVTANINSIVGFHRSTERDIDVSVHFNAFSDSAANGTGVLYRRPEDEHLASRVAQVIAKAGDFVVRHPQGGATLPGAQFRNNLGFLNSLVSNPTILLEICFVTSQRDADLYRQNFEAICAQLAQALVE